MPGEQRRRAATATPDLDAHPEVPADRGVAWFFRGQLVHLGSIPFLALIAYAFAGAALGGGGWLGLTDTTWFALCLGVPIVHQVVVWSGWRAQLGWRVFSRIFAARDLLVWRVLFMPLLLARPLALVGLAVADRGSAPFPPALGWVAGGLLMAPTAYAMSSVLRHFAIERAVGGDHFREHYRRLPPVREGAFRWTPNAMYLVVFLGLWGIALIAGSLAALAAAFFQHAYIWAHYVGTEEPDMRTLYDTE